MKKKKKNNQQLVVATSEQNHTYSIDVLRVILVSKQLLMETSDVEDAENSGQHVLQV